MGGRASRTPSLRPLTGERELAAALLAAIFPPDPGQLRLLAALRATLAGLLTFLLVIVLGALLPPPLAPGPPDRILGFAVALFAAATLHDPIGRQRALSLALVPLAAFVPCAAAALLQDQPLAEALAVPALMFAATYGGARGPRWGALGSIALIAYIIGLVTRQPPASLAAQALVVCVGAADVALLSFVVLPERPATELARLRRSVRRRIARVLGRIAAAARVGGWRPETLGGLRRELDRLGETMLMTEARLAAVAAQQPGQAGLGMHLLEVQLAVERAARVSQQDLGQGALPGRLRDKLAELGQALAADRIPPPLEAGPSALEAALARVARVVREPPRADAALLSPPSAVGAGPALRPALQAAIAAALAVGCGELVSPRRWYWAAFTAFAMFQGTRSRGESIAKVAQFMTGTLAGVLAGVLLATALAGRTLLSLAAIVVAVFLAFQAFMAAYAVMTFWITIILGLLFGMLGYFAPALLLLRLEESAVGAGCGVLVASLVLVRPTRATTEAAIAAFLRAVGALVDAALPGLVEEQPAPELPARLLEVEQRLQELRAAARPAVSGLNGWRNRPLRRRLLLLAGCESWVRELGAIALSPAAPADPGLAEVTRQVVRRIDAVIDRLLGQTLGSERPDETPAELRLPPIADLDNPSHRAMHLLLRIEAALVQLTGMRNGLL